jgi:hypothetical protein
MAKQFSVRATVVLAAALFALSLGAALAPGIYFSAESSTYRGASTTTTASTGLLFSTTTVVSTPSQRTDYTTTTMNSPDDKFAAKLAACFTVFIIASLLALVASATVFVWGERARIIAFKCIAFVPIFLIAGVILSNELYLVLYNQMLSVSLFSSVVVSMPGRSLAISGVSLSIITLIGLFRWQRNDSPNHYGGLANLQECWPHKPFPTEPEVVPEQTPTITNPILVVVTKGSAQAF